MLLIGAYCCYVGSRARLVWVVDGPHADLVRCESIDSSEINCCINGWRQNIIYDEDDHSIYTVYNDCAEGFEILSGDELNCIVRHLHNGNTHGLLLYRCDGNDQISHWRNGRRYGLEIKYINDQFDSIKQMRADKCHGLHVEYSNNTINDIRVCVADECSKYYYYDSNKKQMRTDEWHGSHHDSNNRHGSHHDSNNRHGSYYDSNNRFNELREMVGDDRVTIQIKNEYRGY